MGQGGFITLVNGTKYDWHNTYQHQYQMNSWSFPSVIPAGKSDTVYVEWDQGIFTHTGDDAGEVTYTLGNTGLNFQVQARAANGFDLRVVFTNLVTRSSPQGTTIDLGWVHDGYVTFVLAGKVGAFTATGLPTAWMHENLDVLGNQTLRQLCMPGSHDAGMSTLVSGTAFANQCNTLTQSAPILGQLTAGVRYFDVRPVISAGQFLTGHYGYISQLNSWQGGNGQSIQSIITDVNAYTAANKELVVLRLSHDLNTDLGNSSYAPFTQDEWNRLLSVMKGLANLYVAPGPTTIDLTQLPLNNFIGGNRAAVVVIVDPSGSNITLGDFVNQGFYTPANFPLYDNYSNTNDVGQMINDQLAKMRQQRTAPTSPMFLLSWTLTQDATQASTCFLGTASSIRDLANTANPQLYSKLLPACTAACYPNVLYIDNIQSSNVAAMAMAVNWLPIPLQ